MYKTIILAIGLTLLTPFEMSKEIPIQREVKVVKLTSKEIVKPKQELEHKERIYIPVELTGYCNCYKCCQNIENIGITTSGYRASRGTVAVPKPIKLGSTLYINNKRYRAEDRGGAIVVRSNGTYIIDIWFKTHQEALNFGRVKAKMYKENNKYYIEYKEE